MGSASRLELQHRQCEGSEESRWQCDGSVPGSQETWMPCKCRQQQAHLLPPAHHSGHLVHDRHGGTFSRERISKDKSETSLVKSFGPSSCSTQFNTKFFTLFSRIFLWTLCPLLLSYYHTIILLIFILQLSHHHQIIIVCWM